MDMKSDAEALWTRLVLAMRQDGMIGDNLTQAGPATANVIVSLLLNPPKDAGWFSENIKPKDNATVVWALLDNGEYELVRWSSTKRVWLSCDDMRCVVVKWTFLPKVKA